MLINAGVIVLPFMYLSYVMYIYIYYVSIIVYSSSPPIKVSLTQHILWICPGLDLSSTRQDPCSFGQAFGGCELNERWGTKSRISQQGTLLGEHHPSAVSARTSNFNLSVLVFFNKPGLHFLDVQFIHTGKHHWWQLEGQWQLSSVCIKHQVSWKIKAPCRWVLIISDPLFQREENHPPLAQWTSTLCEASKSWRHQAHKSTRNPSNSIFSSDWFVWWMQHRPQCKQCWMMQRCSEIMC